MDKLACQVEADAWHLLGWDGQMGVDKLGGISDPIASDELDQYNAYYSTLDPRRQLAANSMGAVIACHHHFDERFVSGSEFYQCLSAHRPALLDGRKPASRPVPPISDRSAARAWAGAFRFRPVAGLTRLLPHFDRAFRLMERGQTVARAGEIAAAGVEATPLAVIALDRMGRVMPCNQRGEKLLQEENVLRLRNGMLTCAGGYLASRLSRRLRRL